MSLETGLLQDLLDNMQHPPEPNCSCFISPPCNDCVEHSGLRDAIANAEAYIKIQSEVIE